MPLPAPAVGLVVHYGFVWAGAERAPPADAGRDRPCLIIDLFETEEGGRRVRRVTYLPISHTPPQHGEAAIPIPPAVARHLGLSGERSWLYTSYAVEDDWPFDLALRPGSRDRFDYGFAPPRLIERVAAEFAAFLERRKPLRR